MSHISRFKTNFKEAKLFTKVLNKFQQTNADVTVIKKLKIDNSIHYQLDVLNKDLSIKFLWTDSGYEAAVDLVNFELKMSFEMVLSHLYSNYVAELIREKNNSLEVREIVSMRDKNVVRLSAKAV
jgi:hypothetical protein